MLSGAFNLSPIVNTKGVSQALIGLLAVSFSLLTSMPLIPAGLLSACLLPLTGAFWPGWCPAHNIPRFRGLEGCRCVGSTPIVLVKLCLSLRPFRLGQPGFRFRRSWLWRLGLDLGAGDRIARTGRWVTQKLPFSPAVK